MLDDVYHHMLLIVDIATFGATCYQKLKQECQLKWKWAASWQNQQNGICAQRRLKISLGIRPVWSESSLSAWRKFGSLSTYWAHSEDSGQTGWSDSSVGAHAILSAQIWCQKSHTRHPCYRGLVVHTVQSQEIPIRYARNIFANQDRQAH